MTIKILINGAGGRMGQEACKALRNENDFTIVGECHRDDNLAAKIKSTGAQVVVDLTVPDVVYENTRTIIEAGAHPVIGTSGLTLEQVQELQQQCESLKHGGIIAPNFSIGAVLMMKYAQDAARYYSHVEIIEMHHDQKKDAPSGTAIKTAAMIAEHITPTIPNPADPIAHIPIHSVRLPGLMAHQLVMYGAKGEILTIRHDTMDRGAFMAGVSLCCRRVLALKKLVYGIEGLL